MKALMITTAALIALTGPVAAQSPMEIAREHFLQDHEPGDGPRYVFKQSGTRSVSISTSNSSPAAIARAHLAQDHETGDGARYRPGVSPVGTFILPSDDDLTQDTRGQFQFQ